MSHSLNLSLDETSIINMTFKISSIFLPQHNNKLRNVAVMAGYRDGAVIGSGFERKLIQIGLIERFKFV